MGNKDEIWMVPGCVTQFESLEEFSQLLLGGEWKFAYYLKIGDKKALAQFSAKTNSKILNNSDHIIKTGITLIFFVIVKEYHTTLAYDHTAAKAYYDGNINNFPSTARRVDVLNYQTKLTKEISQAVEEKLNQAGVSEN